MDRQAVASTTIDEYIAAFPEKIRERLHEIRKAIRSAAPEAQEKISYRMPTFYQEGTLVHFAAYKNHIGFYPTASGITAFANELTEYKHAKGSAQFPHDRPLPIELINRIVTYRLAQNLGRAKRKSSGGNTVRA